MVSLPLPPASRRMLPAAALYLVLAAPALAQGTDEQREACTPDALKLCSDTIPDIPKTTACMKAHQAALSPRCRAVFDEPATKEPAVAAASRAAEAKRAKHPRREASAGDDRDNPAPLRHHRQTTTAPYADPLRGADVDAAGVEDRGVAPGGPDDGYGGPDIRHFAPGDGPDEAGPPPPYGDERDGGGPRYLGPGAWGGPRFADRGGPDDAPGPRGGRPPGYDGPPEIGPDDGAPRAERDRWARHGARPARAVIARMCASGEIDPRTCAETLRALGRQRD